MESSDQTTELTFEQTLEKIRDIVTWLESGELALEDAINAYREGAGLIDRSRKLIADAELRVRELSADNAPNV